MNRFHAILLMSLLNKQLASLLWLALGQIVGAESSHRFKDCPWVGSYPSPLPLPSHQDFYSQVQLPSSWSLALITQCPVLIHRSSFLGLSLLRLRATSHASRDENANSAIVALPYLLCFSAVFWIVFTALCYIWVFEDLGWDLLRRIKYGDLRIFQELGGFMGMGVYGGLPGLGYSLGLDLKTRNLGCL